MLRSLFAWCWAKLFGRASSPPARSPSKRLQETSALPLTTYAPKAFDCSAIRGGAGRLLSSRVSEEQERLILCEAGAQSVAAGAGSGKSSTLVRRLLLMRHALSIPLTDITVFTFTRNSRQDFIEKLLETAKGCSIALSRELAEARVKTFHSKLLQLVGPTLPQGMQIFEFLGKTEKRSKTATESQNALVQMEALADDEDNPYASELTADKAQVLRAVYEEAYQLDESFRTAIAMLVAHAHRDYRRLDVDDEKDWANRSTARWRDDALTEWLVAHWSSQGHWPVEGLSPPPRMLKVEQFEFASNGYVPSVNLFVVLAGYQLPNGEVYRGDTKFRPSWASLSKRRILLRGCSEAIFFIQTPEDIKRLKNLLAVEQAIREHRAPIFECRLPGEGGSQRPIAEALYEFGAFVENIGLKPAETFALVRHELPNALELSALYAVALFFRAFEAYKSREGISTFNDLFFSLRKGSAVLQAIPTERLRSVKHLLIDEFQDISPLIVSMIEGLHAELLRRSRRAEQPTLLAVGDDWQSIYGWRGSAPRFFLEFAKLFSGASPHAVLLEDNYRSTQNIVASAAQVLAPISPQYKIHKSCRAANERLKDLPIPLYVVEELVDGHIFKVLQRFQKLKLKDEDVLVVARTGKVRDSAKFACERLNMEDVRVMTVHGSKGLEADYVLVLEDFSYAGTSPIKNALYRHAGFSQTFDESQRDEALRVAYVALTRAKRMCVWMGRRRDDGAMSTIRDGLRCSRRVDFALLLDELDEISSGLMDTGRFPERTKGRPDAHSL